LGATGKGDVAAIIAAKISAGILPTNRPPKMFAGPSTGNRCSGCDFAIAPGGLEYEFQASDGGLIWFDAKCLAMWDDERAKGLTRKPAEARKPPVAAPQRLPDPICPVCSEAILPGDGVVRQGHDLLHIFCWSGRRQRPVAGGGTPVP
jgi:hypothetical protein